MPLHVSELSIALRELDEWDIFATHLPDITQTDIRAIKCEVPGNTEQQKMALFNKWLKVCPNASWSNIVTALSTIRENTLALKIKSEYITKDTDTSVSSGIVSFKTDHTSESEDDPYAYNKPEQEIESTAESELSIGQQEPQNDKTTEKKSLSWRSDAPDLIEEEECHKQTTKQKMSLMNQRDQLRNEISELRNEISELKQNLEDTELSHKQELNKIQELNKKHLNEIEKLKESLHASKHCHETQIDQKHKEEIDQLNKKIQTLQNEKSQQNVRIKNSKIETDRINHNCQRLESSKSDLEKEQHKQIEEFTKMKNKGEKERDELNAKIEAKNRQYERMEKRLKAAEDNHKQEMKDALKVGEQKYEEQINSSQKEMETQRTLLQKERSEKSSLEAENEHKQTQINNHQAQYDSVQIELIKLQQENKQLKLKLTDYVQSRLQFMQEEMASLQQQNKQLHVDRKKTNKDLDEKDQLQHKRIEQLKENIEMIKKELVN